MSARSLAVLLVAALASSCQLLKPSPAQWDEWYAEYAEAREDSRWSRIPPSRALRAHLNDAYRAADAGELPVALAALILRDGARSSAAFDGDRARMQEGLLSLQADRQAYMDEMLAFCLRCCDERRPGAAVKSLDALLEVYEGSDSTNGASWPLKVARAEVTVAALIVQERPRWSLPMTFQRSLRVFLEQDPLEEVQSDLLRWYSTYSSKYERDKPDRYVCQTHRCTLEAESEICSRARPGGLPCNLQLSGPWARARTAQIASGATAICLEDLERP